MSPAPCPVLALASELIRRASVTPEDAGCQDLLAARLAPLGFRAERVAGGGVDNLWLRRGDAGPLLVFAGHTDVVPSGPPERWRSPPFEATLHDGLLFGRGAADMKSSLAAFVVAIEQVLARHPALPGSLALLLTSDEEGPARDGTVRVVERLQARHETIDWCLVGEPTCVDRLGDTIKNGRRGSLSGRLEVLGVQGHVAYPQLARNPVHQLAPALAELAGARWDDGNADFPATTFQVSNIHGGTGAGNVIPGSVELLFNFRYSTESHADSLRARTEAILQRHGLEYRLDWEHGAQPFLTARGPLVDALRAAIRQATGVEAAVSTTGGTSDGRFIARWCREVVEFGPVNASIHKIDEHVRVDDLPVLAGIYGGLIEQLLLKEAPR
ncbi:MAG: succinyl-diaminopimelate desuccinylase [Pseudomonadota bacterium]|nr:succinyl-diaminopimelate desuccinylase [Pseudomonadota bacterium]